MKEVLLDIVDANRTFRAGDQELTVLKNINLKVHRGEMIAIVGSSGSGKSTLMNILGCLDKASSGHYFINGQDTSQMDENALAALRREYFGFIFQRYHLLGDLSAVANVEVPALYANEDKNIRRTNAENLLSRLGLSDRLDHKPNQLSGGQQQRVSVARALINGGDVILADEPTGALDSTSGEEMMALLQELHKDGHTIILVTHDPQVAAFADRIIEIKDGKIKSDRTTKETSSEETTLISKKTEKVQHRFDYSHYLEALKMALIAMSSHRLRTFLTMLGIIIGIASVVSVVALGTGSQQAVLENMASMGTNTIEIKPGNGLGDRRSGRVRTLTASDAEALKSLPFVDSVTPTVRTNVAIRYGNQDVTASIEGVGEEYFRVRGYTLAQGQYFDATSVDSLAQVAVIDSNTVKTLFPNGNAIGQIIFLGKLPVKVIGVTEPRENAFGNTEALNVWIPYTTVAARIFRQDDVNDITVRINDIVSSTAAEQSIIQLIKMRHGVEDFFTVNTDTIRENIEKTSATMTLLISTIAFISLIVGGIGVMNIMLVSVTERTREIGIRMAVGARKGDILRQFLIEAVLVCICGGLLGITLAFAIGLVFASSSSQFQMVYSMNSIIAAFACSTLIGLLFGYLPAQSAAKLNPVDALSRD